MNNSKELTNEMILKCIVSGKKVIPYWDANEPILGKPFYSILKTFQFEVFSFLVGTRRISGSFGRLMDEFNKYFGIFEVKEERIGRALDIALDAGFIKATWVIKDGKFFREFANDSEASDFFEAVLENYRNNRVQENIQLFEELE